MAYNTGNAVGSTDARDLYDNAVNLDIAVNSPAARWTDRLGVSRPSWAGIAAYADLGDYASGLQISGYNEIFRHEGEYYKVLLSTSLPYTTTGSWSDDAVYFGPIGDALMRQDLTERADDVIGYYRNAINCNEYGGLQSALADSDTIGKIIIVTDDQTITSSIDTAGRKLDVEFGGSITVNSGKTLTINGPFSCGLFQCFDGGGSVVFGSGSVTEVYPEWWGAKGDGVQNDTLPIQQLFNSIKSIGADVCFSSGTYLISTPANETGYSFSSAIIIRDLAGTKIYGNGQVVFKAGIGLGAPNFYLFRIEQSTNIEMCGFLLDGDYTNHTGDGGSRSGGIYVAPFSYTDNGVDLTPCNGIHIHHVECNNIGGFFGVLRRNQTAYDRTVQQYNIVIEHCRGVDAAQANNCIGIDYTTNAVIRHNRFTNTPVADPYPSLFIDVSRGCTDVDVCYNYGTYFVFGLKTESVYVTQPSGAIQIFASNVNVHHNEFLQIGHPTKYELGTDSAAGASYGIKLNGANIYCYNNLITGLTSGGFVTAEGGGTSGIYIVHSVENLNGTYIVDGNTSKDNRYGILVSISKTNAALGVYAKITNNIIRNATLIGILAQTNTTVSHNKISYTGGYAINIQLAENTIVESNEIYNCSSTGSIFSHTDPNTLTPVYYNYNGYVIYEEELGDTAGYFAVKDNKIVDTRGASAAQYGYVLVAGSYGTPYSSKYLFNAGHCEGLAADTVGADYVSLFTNKAEEIKCTGVIIGSTLSFSSGHNIASVTAVDASTVQINFLRATPTSTFKYILTPLTSAYYYVPYGATTTYARVKCYDYAGTVKNIGSFHITLL